MAAAATNPVPEIEADPSGHPRSATPASRPGTPRLCPGVRITEDRSLHLESPKWQAPQAERPRYNRAKSQNSFGRVYLLGTGTLSLAERLIHDRFGNRTSRRPDSRSTAKALFG
jgi:hypothetical protein